MPIAFTVFRNKISAKQFCTLLYLFLLLVFVTAITITSSFYKNISDVLRLYSEGRVIETPFSHIRYSLMAAFAILAGFYLFKRKFYLRYPFERWLILSASLFLIYFLHLLAVRSGIVALYLCGLYMIFYFIFRIKNFRLAMLLVALIILIPITAYLAVPTVKLKINYMRFDLEQLFLFKNAKGLSDAGRLMSVEKGSEIFREHWLTGVGIGDLKVEMKKKLDQAPEKPNYLLLPHNQFLFVAAGTGIFGLIIFCVAVFLPLFCRRCSRNWLFMCFHIMMISSFFTEATVEEQMGTAFYITFSLLLYFYYQYNETETAL
jgi:O-antigen ligase